MGLLDDLKHKVEQLGDKAKEGLDDARDRAGDLVDDVKDRLGQHDAETAAPTSESSDIGPDTTSTETVQPDYVAAEDDVTGTDADESSLTDDAEADAEAEQDDPPVDEDPSASSEVADVVEQEALVTEPGELPAAELDGVDLQGGELLEDDDTDVPAPQDDQDDADGADVRASAADDPAVEADVDPYDSPLTESIGDAVDADALAEAVDTGSDDQAPST